jgi:hypothetical protein
MAFDAVDVRGVIQRLTQEYRRRGQQAFFLIEAMQHPWANSGAASEPAGSAVCSSCRHRQCRDCEECSVGKEYSGYWICHCCGALTHRLPSWH